MGNLVSFCVFGLVCMFMFITHLETELRRTQLDTSVLKTENSVSNPSRIPFADRLETELSVSNFDFSCSASLTSKKNQ